MTRPLQVAIFCGATPLTIGSLIYWAWRGTRWHWLEEAGILNIIGGLVLFFVGTICLIWHINHEARSEHKCRRPLTRQSLLVGGLLLVNFPAAALYGLSVIGLMTQYTVRVINESGTTIDSFVLIGPHVHVDVGPIPMGDVKSRSLAFNGDGTLDF